MPSTNEIREWLLIDGVHNNVMDSYSALTCWEKADVRSVLRRCLSKEEFQGIRDIIRGLLDEAALPGISLIDDRDKSITAFLEQAVKHASTLADYEVISEIEEYYRGEDENHAITGLCQEVLMTDRCRNVVSQAITKGQAIRLAQRLNIDCGQAFLALIAEDFQEHFHLAAAAMKDPVCRPMVMDVFRDKLPLAKMIPNPIKSNGEVEMWRLCAFEHMLQALRCYPGKGQDFVLAAIQCTPISTVNCGLFVIEYWVQRKGRPLREWLPDFNDELCALKRVISRSGFEERVEKILSGNIKFKDVFISEQSR